MSIKSRLTILSSLFVAAIVFAAASPDALALEPPPAHHQDDGADRDRGIQKQRGRGDTERRASRHILSLRFATGERSFGYTFGLSLTSDVETSDSLFSAQLGLHVSLLTGDHTALDAGLGRLVARLGYVSDVGGVSIEGGIGAGSGSGETSGIAHVGVFYGYHFFEVGYMYQAPIGVDKRPAWLNAHSFVVRVALPL